MFPKPGLRSAVKEGEGEAVVPAAAEASVEILAAAVAGRRKAATGSGNHGAFRTVHLK
jgi:hypothetical protein